MMIEKDHKTAYTENKYKVVMSGPLPPAIGGMATVIDDMSRSSLDDNVELHLFNTLKNTPENRPFWQGVLARFVLWKKWIKALNNKKTIAHIHTCSGLTFFLDGTLLILARLKGCPTVLHIHGATFDAFLDGLPPIQLMIACWLMNRANRVVVLSEEWKEKLSDHLPDARLFVIPNGVPVLELIKKTVKDASTVKVLFLGNLCQRKGVWELLEAMTQTPRNIELILAGGEEDPDIGEKVNQYIDDHNLKNVVRWLGPIQGEQKLAALQNADIFILPSHAEGLPISLLEAMCAGIAVVVTPVGGIPSVVDDEVQGLLVTPGDSHSIVVALTRLASDANMRTRMGQAARTRCSESYGVERAAAKYLEMYRAIV